MSDAVILINELDDLTTRLDNAGKEIYRLQEELQPTQEDFDDTFNDLLVALLDSYEAEGKRLPGEDVRNALVTKQMRTEHAELYGRHRRLRGELDRKERLAKSIERQISSKQSSLSYLKTEAMATA